MPFFAIPKNVADIVMRKRVVVNESYVPEFYYLNEHGASNTKKSNKVASFSSSNSPRSSKSLSHALSNINQAPLLAHMSSSNPFFDNRFPTWSYTDLNTGCSLIVVPDCSPNRQEECDIIIKNYNSVLCDEASSSRSLSPINIANTLYSDYEFYKLEVPFTFDKIESSYLKLMNICSFKNSSLYYSETETFYSRLNNTKWLRHISAVLALTGKIVNCLSYFQRNVFLEERRHNTDCSCIISSLTKICLNSEYRTIIGLENLIQKDWFLAGHLFFKRLHSTSSNSTSEDFVESNEKRRSSLDSNESLSTQNDNSNKSNKGDMAPTFLLFLDCLFQLLIQYPSEFEYNEFYLINLWDYALSGLSFTYSFNGVSDWFNYLNNQTFLVPSSSKMDPLVSNLYRNSLPFENNYLNEMFDENNKFWINHLDMSIDSNKNSIFLNKFFQTNSNDKKELIPCERVYMLKFWSRCYLRWIEKYHAYNSYENEYKDSSESVQQHRAPPVPPTLKYPKVPSSNSISSQLDEAKTKITSIADGERILVTTRITPDGNIESSF